ncbi:ATPase [Nostocoides sp. F2B08]|uniref:SRPBCC family protein n=1 Tax=Nostocoides sp. F2B08 TaxID=2653936 RepID=UPI001262E21D|nr:SRPBCC family protein [Tetrasphaera sp. F2B08]KAB7745333.1 ATPase [Tetrasphaera sp. F2B08]
MPVDVTTEIVIARPIADVWAYASDPTTAPQWYANIDRVELVTPGRLEVGSRMLFSARFLGRTLTYTYEVHELEPGRRLTMSTSEGPFPMTTTYSFDAVDAARTRMTLRNHGEPSGFGAIAAPAMSMAMRRANRADLARIRAILEGASS